MIDTCALLLFAYILMGISLMLYWWNNDYALDYARAKAKGEVQDSAACLLILGMIVLWPLKLIIKFINYIRTI